MIVCECVCGYDKTIYERKENKHKIMKYVFWLERFQMNCKIKKT